MTQKQASYDLVIIGGGLAGLALAIQSGRQGYKTLVLEKDDYPKHKVCGEYISMESKPFLESIGLPVGDMNLPVIQNLQVTDTKGYSINAALPQGGFGISRYKLDAALAEIARQHSVTILTKSKAENVSFAKDAFMVYTSDNSFTTGVVCGAWGKRSNIDVKIKRGFIASQKRALNNYIGVKYHITYSWPEDLIALHNFRNGYCGISRVEEDACCLCYLTTSANLQSCGNDIKKMENDILMRNPYLKDIFTKARFLYEQPLVISQISFQQKEQTYDHILLAGDTAGLITPLCGNGMSMAFHASKIVFETAHQFLQGHISRQQMEDKYRKEWHKQFSTRLTAGRILQSNFGKEKTTSRFLKTINKLPFLKTAFINYSSGKPF